MNRRKRLAAASLAVLTYFAGTGRAQYTINTLASFNSINGSQPDAGLTLLGNTLYGTTSYGGANNDGTVFSVPVTGGSPTVLANFNGSNGENPEASLTFSADGSTLYGTTYGGGAANEGVVFSVPITGGAPTLLASFNIATGQGPAAGLTLSADGKTLYGTTFYGGTSIGEVFSVPVTGGSPRDLYSGTGQDPEASLILSADGNTLYGTASHGGANGVGTVFAIPLNGSGNEFSSSFNGSDGAYPKARLTLSADGKTLYGTTFEGGTAYGGNDPGYGTVFSIPATGGPPTLLASFVGGDNADAFPGGGLTLVGNTLYGTTYGSEPFLGNAGDPGAVFSVPVSGGSPTLVAKFNGGNGANPYTDLTLSADGNTLYGTTQYGGANNDGTVFSLTIGAVPEPASLGFLAFGATTLLSRRQNRFVGQTRS